jgi:hypothetical protein
MKCHGSGFLSLDIPLSKSENVSKGIYIVSLRSGNLHYSKKLVVQ